MTRRDDDIAVLKRLMEAGRFPAMNAEMSARGAASVALTLMCGVPLNALAALRREHWLPGGREVVVIDPEGYYGLERAAKARSVPVLTTAKVVVERYLAIVGPRAAESPLFLSVTGGACSKTIMFLAFDRAARGIGLPGLRLGRARALFAMLVEEANDRHDGMAEYLIGENRFAGATYGYANPPPDDAMRALLERAFPFHRPWRLLTHSGGGRGPKLARAAPRATVRRVGA